ncbi:MAG: hypothetical protein WCD35_13515 [Mycobacteriales bacterium]
MRIPSRLAAPVATFVAVVALAAAVALLTGGHDSPAPPRALHLAASPVRDAASGVSSGGGTYTLTGSLPAGRPADAAVWELARGPADSALVTRLASALHAGAPVRSGTGWRAGSLVVSGEAGQSWWYSACGPDTTVSSGDAVGGCAVPGTGAAGSGSAGTAAPVPAEPSPVPAASVREHVAPVLTALGLAVGDATVSSGPWGGAAALDRTIGGLDTVGLTTHVDVDRQGLVTFASGWLGEATKGDSYPLVSAQQAFEALPALPRALLCPIGPDGKGCGAPTPIEVTGAHLGLSLQPLADGGQVLVPSWLFDVKGGSEPVVGVAVEPRFLTPTEPSGTPSAVPVPPPGTTTPATPAPARSPFAFDGAARASVAAAVVVRYGDSSSCPHAHVTHAVKESATTVVVVLEADALPQGIACTTDYRPMTLQIPLQAALGQRTVVDGTTGRAVPLTSTG